MQRETPTSGEGKAQKCKGTCVFSGGLRFANLYEVLLELGSNVAVSLKPTQGDACVHSKIHCGLANWHGIFFGYPIRERPLCLVLVVCWQPMNRQRIQTNMCTYMHMYRDIPHRWYHCVCVRVSKLETPGPFQRKATPCKKGPFVFTPTSSGLLFLSRHFAAFFRLKTSQLRVLVCPLPRGNDVCLFSLYPRNNA